jgi:hypothetical protein
MSLFSTASDFAKDQWLDTYTDQLSSSEGSMLQLLGLNTDERVKMEGRRTYMKVQVGSDKGFGMMTQGGDFPISGDIDSDEATLELHRFGSTIEFDSHEMALLDSLDAAAAPIMAKKMDESRKTVLRHLERQAIMDGSGAIAKVASEVGSVLTLDVAGNAYTERNPYTWLDDANRAYYSVVDPTSGAEQTTAADYFTVSAIAEASNEVTCSIDTGGAAAGDLLVHYYGGDAWTSGGNYRSLEYDGLLAAIDDGNTYLGLNRTTAALAFWKALVLDNSGTARDLTEALIDEFLNKVERRSDDQMLNRNDYCAITDPGTYTSYLNLMRSGIRYTVSETPDIGWGGRMYVPMNDVKLYKHHGAPRRQIMLIHKPSIKFVGPKHDTSSIVKYVDRGGSIFFQQTASSGQGYADKVIAMIAGWIGMYTDRPRNHGRLDDLNMAAAAY